MTGFYLPLRAGRIGGQRWLVHCTPHFLFFFQKKKRKRAVHGPKEKKKERGRCGGAEEILTVKYASLQSAA